MIALRINFMNISAVTIFLARVVENRHTNDIRFRASKGFMLIWQSSGTQNTTRTVLLFLFDLVSRSFKSVTKHLREGINSQVQEPPFTRATVAHASTSWSIFFLIHCDTHAHTHTHTHTHTHAFLPLAGNSMP